MPPPTLNSEEPFNLRPVDSRDVPKVGHIWVMVGEDGLGSGFDVAHPYEACGAEGELYAEV